MQVTLTQIPTREILHFLGWHGTPVEPGLMETIKRFQEKALRKIEPRVVVREFELLPDGMLAHTHFLPLGKDVPAMLSDCRSAVLLAATLGAESERMLLREQSRSAADALILDAVLSAAVEAVCDEQEERLRGEFAERSLFLTDRFSPGYGDMPIAAVQGNLRSFKYGAGNRLDGQPKRYFDASKVSDGCDGRQPNGGSA